MKRIKRFTSFRVLKELDYESAQRGWDGDMPLDPKREWTPYILTLQGECAGCGEWTDIDTVGGCWASGDNKGVGHLRDAIGLYLLTAIEGQRKPGRKTIEIVEMV